MSSIDFVVIAVIAGLISLAIYKIARDKKRGVKCSGCSECCNCPDNKSHK
ncbi:MAG: FeoB-associated Cys-rich membrane protein [Dehalobacterium sp.]